MKRMLIAIAAALLSGCVVAPYPRAYGPSPVVVYPEVYWEPSVSLWFRVSPRGDREYFPRGYEPRRDFRGYGHGHGHGRRYDD